MLNMVELDTVINLKKVREINTRKPIETLADAVALLGGCGIVERSYESAYGIYLNEKLRPISFSQHGAGTDSRCPLDIKSMVCHALLENSHNVILIHTHPRCAGDFTGPSNKDIETTRELEEKLAWFNINLVDSQILYDQDEENIGVFSLKDFIHYLDEENQRAQARSKKCVSVARLEQLTEI